eukprot:scaffold77194_cov33-Tisochrysis_lutea.AAC.1
MSTPNTRLDQGQKPNNSSRSNYCELFQPLTLTPDHTNSAQGSGHPALCLCFAASSKRNEHCHIRSAAAASNSQKN